MTSLAHGRPFADEPWLLDFEGLSAASDALELLGEDCEWVDGAANELGLMGSEQRDQVFAVGEIIARLHYNLPPIVVSAATLFAAQEFGRSDLVRAWSQWWSMWEAEVPSEWGLDVLDLLPERARVSTAQIAFELSDEELEVTDQRRAPLIGSIADPVHRWVVFDAIRAGVGTILTPAPSFLAHAEYLRSCFGIDLVAPTEIAAIVVPGFTSGASRQGAPA